MVSSLRVIRRPVGLVLVGLSLALGSPAFAQESSRPGQIDLASLDIPGRFVLPPSEAPTAAEPALMLPPAGDTQSQGQTAGASAVLDRQLRWRKARNLELVYQALNVVDAVQTISCLRGGKCTEANPLFGSNPSTSKIIGMKLAGVPSICSARATCSTATRAT